MNMEYEKHHNYLDSAQNYADRKSTCVKVQVGSVIQSGALLIFGSNHGVCNCNINGCRRIKLYGENSKQHRLPSDCDSVHSEIDAIAKAAKMGIKLDGATIYITRYPCEACARAIVSAGIKKVIYGRKESISEYTRKILDSAQIEVWHILDWNREDNNA